MRGVSAHPLRPEVDVVVPFAGSDAALGALVARLAELRLAPGDTVTVADNRPRAADRSHGRCRVVAAGDFRGSYHARNVGARGGSAPWILFLDADVQPIPDLADRLFDPPPAAGTGALAGGVIDQPPPYEGRATARRYAWLKSSMSQEHTLGHAAGAFAQTANCAFRREAFDAVGGFADSARSGGDADLCLRLAASGWELEYRPAAGVVHVNRATIAGMLAQRARHGAGAAWIGSRHPGALPARSLPGVLRWSFGEVGAGLRARMRGDRDAALVHVLDGPAVLAFELGRRLPNRRVWQPRARAR